VTIVVIALLLGLLLAIGSATGSHQAKTRVTLQTLLTIADEYAAQTKGSIVNHVGNFPFDWTVKWPFTVDSSGWGKPDDSSERFVMAVMQIAESRDMILQLEATKILVDQDNDGFLELRDAWGSKIVYMASNNQLSAQGGNSLLPHHLKRFFASTGEPDNQGLFDFGEHSGPDGIVGTGDDFSVKYAGRAPLKNDIYSFEIE